ncbi:MAG: class I SAM-dependent methyltransferase [Isosphaeraceae bacterium]
MARTDRVFVPDGHFYSPMVDLDEAERDHERIWPGLPALPAGIDFDHDGHERFLNGAFAHYMREYDYPDDAPAGGGEVGFYHNNNMFSLLDSRALFVMLRATRPRKMVEIGSGFSSLLTADVNRRFLGGSLDFTCVEPYPSDFLRGRVAGITRVIEARAQDLDVSDFGLGAGDILFIDSSHVSKLGSDVNHLYFEVLPRLAPGVLVHLHDIFLPDDYPLHWIREGRNWNEQYVLRALLMDSTGFRVRFAGRYVYRHLASSLAGALGGPALDGCSFWMERTASKGRVDGAEALHSVGARHLVRALARRAVARLRWGNGPGQGREVVPWNKDIASIRE